MSQITRSVSLPRLKDFDWRIDIKTASESCPQLSLPTCLIQMRVSVLFFLRSALLSFPPDTCSMHCTISEHVDIESLLASSKVSQTQELQQHVSTLAGQSTITFEVTKVRPSPLTYFSVAKICCCPLEFFSTISGDAQHHAGRAGAHS